jgi:short-subunit dehydrogenase
MKYSETARKKTRKALDGEEIDAHTRIRNDAMQTNDRKLHWAVVTGASSGIGRAFALELSQTGHPVLLTARRRAELDELAAEIALRGGHAEVVVADLATPEGVETVAQATRALGEIDVLVNNAGVGVHGPFLEQSAARERAEMALNVTAVVELTRAVLPQMVARRRGQIINVASLLSFMPTPWFATYGATKAFVLHFSEALAVELRGSGVRVHASCPGPVATRFFHAAGAGATEGRLPALRADHVARTTLRAAASGRSVRVIGWLYALIAFVTRLTPRAWMRRIMGRILRPEMAS